MLTRGLSNGGGTNIIANYRFLGVTPMFNQSGFRDWHYTNPIPLYNRAEKKNRSNAFHMISSGFCGVFDIIGGSDHCIYTQSLYVPSVPQAFYP
jgi:hypothetical protein